MFPWNVEDLTFDAAHFSGKARLFPVPNLVMFPHVMQPLHIFESRYKEMLNEALDGDGFIAMAVLKPGWEPDYESRPALIEHACLGRIVTHHRTEEGNYNLLLLGLKRIKIVSELPPLRSFREAEVEVVDDFQLTENDEKREDLQAALSKRFEQSLPSGQPANPAFRELLSSEVPLSVLTDLVSFAAPMSFAEKCALLAVNDVDRRALMLLEALNSLDSSDEEPISRPNSGYLPPFSTN